MNKKEIVVVALKLLGIYIVVQGLSSIATFAPTTGFRAFANWSLYFGTFIFLALGLVIIFKANRISPLILKPDDDIVEKFGSSPN